ncbi:site-specific integrase [Yeosuana sp. MJ-SS3]|uniref:Site-specific integrase n=1 Tax=Gilvirhabdus luticola TaxID=3079858 RepID=A0ABU3U7H0_9FLAO|nr:site-specific integrase [Yeosuana sp. MJ-SS3]MDU8886336.1 site-specific integrase [Yeosuana sp. MJ-SS3]
MATIKYILQSKNNPAPIYLRMSLGRSKVLKRKSGYVIDPKSWSTSTGYPKPNNENNKSLKAKLISLEGSIIEAFNNDNAKGKLIDGNWLLMTINKLQNRINEGNKEYLVEYCNYFIENLPYSVNNKGKRGASKATLTKYNTILNKLKGFEAFKKKKYLINQVDLNFRSEFIQYLSEKEKINDNTIGRYISFVKTIVYDARKNGYSLNPQILDFKGFTVKPPIVTLSFDEINIIKNHEFETEKLNAARDWLVIGCYTGQRVSDLLRMKMNMIENIGGYEFIVLEQVKTGNLVQIPIHPEVKKILKSRNNHFPPTFGNTHQSKSAIFNKLIKELCRILEMNKIVEGNLNNPSTGRNEFGHYEKWKLVSSHICRRSFATNFYALEKYPTPLLMNITGHTTESMFLDYIGKKPIDYSIQLAKLWND